MSNTNQIYKVFLSAGRGLVSESQNGDQELDDAKVLKTIDQLLNNLIPPFHIVWGGHPMVTGVVRTFLNERSPEDESCLTLYQSSYYEKEIPKVSFSFETVILTKKMDGEEASLMLMREAMIKNNEFKLAVFVAGKQGVLDEYKLFRKYHPDAPVMAMESTGSYAKRVHSEMVRAGDKNILEESDYQIHLPDILRIGIN